MGQQIVVFELDRGYVKGANGSWIAVRIWVQPVIGTSAAHAISAIPTGADTARP